MVLDVKRASFHGIATRTIYVELPDEESENGKYVGRLNKTLYGTRDAPLAWLRAVRADMEALGFLERKITTGVFVHPVRDIWVVTRTTSVWPASVRTCCGYATRCRRSMS